MIFINKKQKDINYYRYIKKLILLI